MSQWVINGFAVVIVAVWVACVAATFIVPGYSMPVSVQWAVSALAGAAFAKKAADYAGLPNGKRKDDHDDLSG